MAENGNAKVAVKSFDTPKDDFLWESLNVPIPDLEVALIPHMIRAARCHADAVKDRRGKRTGIRKELRTVRQRIKALEERRSGRWGQYVPSTPRPIPVH